MSINVKTRAQRWMEAVYTGDTSVIDELAADDIALTYPVFTQIFDRPTLRGKEAVRRFIERFVTRWAEGRITFDETIEEGNRVALMWTFEAVNVGPLGDNKPVTNEVHRWGGITILHFDANGRVTAEIGEESGPGPMARFMAD